VFSRFLVGAMSYAARIRISLSIFTPKALSMRSAMIALDLRPKMSDNKGVTSQLISLDTHPSADEWLTESAFWLSPKDLRTSNLAARL
jgi:hypothetical protein